MPADRMVEVPTADDRLFWDIRLSPHIMPAVVVSDELGIFTLLAEGPLATADVAERLKLSYEWAEILLGVLAVLQLVVRYEGRFQLTDAARNFFLPASPYYRGFSLRYLAGKLGIAENLRRAVRETYPLLERYEVRDYQEADIDPLEAADGVRTMHGNSFSAAVALARNGDFDGVHRLLDIAGGYGGFSIALAQRFPAMRCTVAELPVVCKLTEGYIAEYGVADQVDTLPLNMFFQPWPTGYDAVLLSFVLHDWGHQHRADLIKRSFDALPTGGRLYIHEMLLSDAADGPYGPALMSLNMRIGTAGKQFTAPELRAALKTTGFGDVAVQHTYGYCSLVTARKPLATQGGSGHEG